MIFHSSADQLFGKDLRWILKGLELQGVSAGIQKEHRGLLAYLALEADVGLDDKIDPMCFQLIGELVPLIPSENCSKMPYRHILSIYFIGSGIGQFIWLDMGGKLMSKEIEIDPFVGASTDLAAEQISVECARLLYLSDRESEVKGFKFAHIG